MARRSEDPAWVPPPRIVMVKAFPEEDVVLVKPELFAECSRRRYLALSDGVKSRFAQAHASSRTKYRKLWRRLLVHMQTSLAMAKALTKLELLRTNTARGHRLDVAGLALIAMYDNYTKKIDQMLSKQMQESLQKAMDSKMEKDKVIAQSLLELETNDEKSGEDFNPMAIMRALRKHSAQKPTKKQFQGSEEEIGVEHTRLLFLVSVYTADANRDAFPGLAEDSELWVRKTQLLVLIYECIRAGALNYDYAPLAETMGSKRVWLNISQEGVDDLDDMCQVGFLSSMKMSSTKYSTSTAYRLTKEGYLHLKTHLRRRDRAAIEEVVYSDKLQPSPRNLFVAKWDAKADTFYLQSASGHTKSSDVTDIEEVSYVSSPFVPKSMRKWGRECTSNKHKTAALVKATGTIRDELDEQLSFDRLRLMVGEWIPMGANQVLSLNDKLGSTDRVAGGYFTSEMDKDPNNPCFQGKVDGLTRVNVLDFEETSYVNFEAEVQYEEEPGIVQIENFGIHVSEEGFMLYGLTLDGMMKVTDGNNFSLDHLARLLRDIGTDSSEVIGNLLTDHQRHLLDLVHMGDAMNREKFNVFFTSRINKRGQEEMPMAHELLDMEDMENEIRQIIGEVECGFQLSRDDELIIIDSTGMILCSKNTEKFEPLVLQYMSMMSRNMFIQALYRQTFVTVDTLGEIDHLIRNHDADPNNIFKIRELMSNVSADIILMREIHSYLLESLTETAPMAINDQVLKRLSKILQLDDTNFRLERRIRDIRKSLDGASGELQALKSAADVIQENKEFKVNEAVSNNTQNLEEVFRANERASTSLEIMQVVLAGSLAFAILDRLHGLYLGVAADIDWSVKAFDWYVQTPMVMFILNMLWWFALGASFNRLIKYAGSKSAGILSIRYTMNCRFNQKAMTAFLHVANPEMEDGEADARTNLKKFTWDETDEIRWKGCPPKIEMIVDMKNGFLLSVFIQIATRRSKCTQSDAKRHFFARLRELGLISGPVPGLETAKDAEYVYRKPFLSRGAKFKLWLKKTRENVHYFFTF